MLLLIIFGLIIAAIVGFIVLKTPEPATGTTDSKMNLPMDAEKKYVESVRILSQMSENTMRASKNRPKVSITLNNLMIDNNMNSKIINARELVNKLTALGDVYIFYKTPKEFAQHQQVSLPFSNVIPAHKIMHCTTEEGLIGMIRQLKPRFHIENNIFVIERLAPHLNQILSLTSTQNELKELSTSDVRRNNILNHNIDFYNTPEDIFNYVAQTLKTK